MGQKELLQEFVEIEHADTGKKNRTCHQNKNPNPSKAGRKTPLLHYSTGYAPPSPCGFLAGLNSLAGGFL